MSASWCRVMTLDRLIGGKDIWLSIGWIVLLLSGMWMVFTRARAVVASNNLLFWPLAQYVVYGESRFRRKLCAGCYSYNRGGGLSSADRLPNVTPEVANPD